MKKRMLKRSLIPVLILVMAFQLAGGASAEVAEPRSWNADGGTYTAHMSTTATGAIAFRFSPFYKYHTQGQSGDYITVTCDAEMEYSAQENLFTLYSIPFRIMATEISVSQSQTLYVYDGYTYQISTSSPSGTYYLYAHFPIWRVRESVTFTDGDVIDIVYSNEIYYVPRTGQQFAAPVLPPQP